jgi:hypothetical protein
MKKQLPIRMALLALAAGCLLTGCFYEDDANPPFVEPIFHVSPYFEGIYMPREEFEESITSEMPRQLAQPGKIWRYNNMLLVNERYSGVHVIDNSNPSSPNFISFIKIPGNVDMAVKGNRLFVDSGPDLVSIDISDVNNIRVVDRVRNVYDGSGVFDPYGYWHRLTNDNNEIFTGFKKANN